MKPILFHLQSQDLAITTVIFLRVEKSVILFVKFVQQKYLYILYIFVNFLIKEYTIWGIKCTDNFLIVYII